jgi:hypothetical protein
MSALQKKSREHGTTPGEFGYEASTRKQEYLAHPVYSRDYPPLAKC